MRRVNIIIVLAALVCQSCFPTRIVTYSPAPYSTYYSTTITPARTGYTTIVSQARQASVDYSLQLDLQAVAALFAQSSTVQEFEQLLNSTSYPVSNLDLNSDGYIDYLRVIETREGYNHVFIIQACLGMDYFEDVATIVTEIPGLHSYTIEIIGAPFIYGPRYYVRPVFVARPLILDWFGRPGYSPWHSPWCWGHFPGHFRHHAPVYLNHYQAYVHTFMGGHHYCHEVGFPHEPHFRDYERMAKPNMRNDFARQNPSKSFTVRNANTFKSGSNTEKVVNAYDIRQNNESSKYTTRTDNSSSASVTGRGTGQTSTVRSSSVAPSSQRGTSTTNSSSRSTTATSSSRSTASGSTATQRGTSATSSSSRNTSAASSSRSSSTGSAVVNSRVSSSGSASTSVRSSSSTGRSSGSSVSRSSGSNSSSSSRSTTATSSSRSTSGSSSSSSRTNSSSSSSRTGSSNSRR